MTKTVKNSPKGQDIVISTKNTSQVQEFVISGTEVRPGLEVKPRGSSAYVGIPKKWIGGEVIVILVKNPPSPIKVETPFHSSEEAGLALKIKAFMEKNTSQSSKQLTQEFNQPQRRIRKACTILVGQGKLRREGRDYFYMDESSKKTG